MQSIHLEEHFQCGGHALPSREWSHSEFHCVSLLWPTGSLMDVLRGKQYCPLPTGADGRVGAVCIVQATRCAPNLEDRTGLGERMYMYCFEILKNTMTTMSSRPYSKLGSVKVKQTKSACHLTIWMKIFSGNKNPSNFIYLSINTANIDYHS